MSKTLLREAFAGRERSFQLRLGEASELERLCNAGIGAIAMRIAYQQYYVADIRETVRLGLQGGGLSEPEATALVMSAIDQSPLAPHIEIAAKIIDRYLNGIPDELKKKDMGDPENPSGPETSPTGTSSAD